MLEEDSLHQDQQSRHTGECIPGAKKNRCFAGAGVWGASGGKSDGKGTLEPGPEEPKGPAQPKSLDLNSN